MSEENNRQPVISIIVPVYNVSKYLRECLDSVINQTFADWVGILIDDGSSDGSGSICDEYAARDHRFRVIHQENRGIVAVRNLGLQAATGDFIAWVDGDDMVHPQWLEAMHHISTTHDCDIAVVNYTGFREINELDFKPIDVKAPIKISQGDAINQLYHYKLSASVWNKLYNKRIIQDTAFCANIYAQRGEDWDFNLQLLLKVPHIYVSQTPLYCYRMREGSLTNAYDINFLIDDIMSQCDIYEHFMATSHDQRYIPLILNRLYSKLLNRKKEALIQGKLDEHAKQIFDETLRRTYADYKACKGIPATTKAAFSFFYRRPRLFHWLFQLRYGIINRIRH